MTREDEPKDAPEPDANADHGEGDADAMSALLKRSLAQKDAPPPADDFLRGVQKRIRTRSKGKFYADGWSTSSPRVSYMLIALVMLIIVALAYFVLGPTGVAAR
jgi:hypothetical protein